MTDEGIDRYLIGDIDDEEFDEAGETVVPPVIVSPTSTPDDDAHYADREVTDAREPDTLEATIAPEQPPDEVAPSVAAEHAIADRATSSRERRLAEALEELMSESSDIEATALVSLDGFIIASALPEGMQEDRVGAMSAAILALGERAAAELGRGQLTQVFIEGADGYVLLVAAGNRAVLTVLAGRQAKLGLVLYDMRAAADTIGEILR